MKREAAASGGSHCEVLRGSPNSAANSVPGIYWNNWEWETIRRLLMPSTNVSVRLGAYQRVPVCGNTDQIYFADLSTNFKAEKHRSEIPIHSRMILKLTSEYVQLLRQFLSQIRVPIQWAATRILRILVLLTGAIG